MSRFIQSGILLMLATLMSGCLGTLATFNTPELFSATRFDGRACTKGGMASVPCNVINVPIDLALDTVLLPYKVVLIATEDDESVEKTQ
jgi:uncharacterized protein YceK